MDKTIVEVGNENGFIRSNVLVDEYLDCLGCIIDCAESECEGWSYVTMRYYENDVFKHIVTIERETAYKDLENYYNNKDSCSIN